MNYSHDNFSYYTKNIGNRKHSGYHNEDSNSSDSEDMDELSVIKFMMEKKFFENSNTKLVGNMTFLNKIIEMSKDFTTNKKISKKDLKENIKHVVEYLMDNRKDKTENLENTFLKKLSKLKMEK